MLKCMLFMLNISEIGISHINSNIYFNVVFPPTLTYTHTQTHKQALLKLMVHIRIKKKQYYTFLCCFCLCWCGGGERSHFSKKRNFIIILNPCGQEWASGRLETQIWNAVGNPWSISICRPCLFLCIWFIVHSFCWLYISRFTAPHGQPQPHRRTKSLCFFLFRS